MFNIENFLINVNFGFLIFTMVLYFLDTAEFLPPRLRNVPNYSIVASTLFQTLFLGLRWFTTHHYPLSNLYESLLFLSCIISYILVFTNRRITFSTGKDQNLYNIGLGDNKKDQANEAYSGDGTNGNGAYSENDTTGNGTNENGAYSGNGTKANGAYSGNGTNGNGGFTPTHILKGIGFFGGFPATGGNVDRGGNQGPPLPFWTLGSALLLYGHKERPLRAEGVSGNGEILQSFIGSILTPFILLINTFATFCLPIELKNSTSLVPALKSNWLMMHVTFMILSYAALFAGCLLAIAYLLVSVLLPETNRESLSTSVKSTLFLKTKKSSQELLANIDNLSYRIIGFGFPLLTIGILSGAVWANQTWGSYWSWDPKETWALITWLVFAIYLHTRIGGFFSGRQSAFIACFGFVIIWICYLGVNLLGKGLHSYGFF